MRSVALARESDQEQQCSLFISNNTDNWRCWKNWRGDSEFWHAYPETKNGNKYLFFIYTLFSTKETQQGESNDSPSMKNKDALWLFHKFERM